MKCRISPHAYDIYMTDCACRFRRWFNNTWVREREKKRNAFDSDSTHDSTLESYPCLGDARGSFTAHGDGNVAAIGNAAVACGAS